MIAAIYSSLNEGQKANLRRKYMALFGNRASFYRKINGQTRVLKAEQIFFQTNLNLNK